MNDFMTKNFKYMVWLAALIVLVIIFFSFRKKSKEDESNPTDDISVDPNNTTLSNNEAIVIAENLLAAMNQYGTDEQAIIDNLEGLTKDDLLLVMKKFGNKPYNGSGLAERGYEIALFSQSLNLIGWLRRELEGDWLNQAKQIFTSNGITF